LIEITPKVGMIDHLAYAAPCGCEIPGGQYIDRLWDVPDLQDVEGAELRRLSLRPFVHRRRPVDARADWHNARAALLMNLNAALEAAVDDASREALISWLAKSLTAATAQKGEATPGPPARRTSQPA
jgi:hypothetical protein